MKNDKKLLNNNFYLHHKTKFAYNKREKQFIWRLICFKSLEIKIIVTIIV